MVVGTGGGYLWHWERECPVQEERGWASQGEAQRKQPEGLMGRRNRYGWCLADYAGRINCTGWCPPGTGTQTPKCQARDLRASPSSRRGSARPHGCRQRWGNEKKPQHPLIETGHPRWCWRGRARRMCFPELLCTQIAQLPETRAGREGAWARDATCVCRYIFNTQIRSREERGETASRQLPGARWRVREADGGKARGAWPHPCPPEATSLLSWHGACLPETEA